MSIWSRLVALLVRFKNGYRQYFDRKSGKWIFVHRRVAEMHGGPIPAGHEVHHVDGNKLHNRPGNLAVIPRQVHQQIHKTDSIARHGTDLIIRRAQVILPPPVRRATPAAPTRPSGFNAGTAAVTGRAPITSGLSLGALLSRASHSSGCCPRCGGSGYLPEFSHVEGGVCFRCNGDGIGHSGSGDRDEYEARQLEIEEEYAARQLEREEEYASRQLEREEAYEARQLQMEEEHEAALYERDMRDLDMERSRYDDYRYDPDY